MLHSKIALAACPYAVFQQPVTLCSCCFCIHYMDICLNELRVHKPSSPRAPPHMYGLPLRIYMSSLMATALEGPYWQLPCCRTVLMINAASLQCCSNACCIIHASLPCLGTATLLSRQRPPPTKG